MAVADYRVVEVRRPCVYLIDLDQGRMSVTNDAEGVVDELLTLYPADFHFVYRDSAGGWDELVHDGTRFSGFRSWQGPIPEVRS